MSVTKTQLTRSRSTTFVGDDNVIAVCPPLEDDAYRDAVDHVTETAGVDLKVGIDRGPTAAVEGMHAKHALEDCRASGTLVDELSSKVPHGTHVVSFRGLKYQ